ncbi:MAG: phosphonate ABC transporter, permease protein PhnE [Propionibacteriaceae bacterium]|jgi:phosphonate transport system permease protein|nr:phosphonate ABC transporter, permease protein PhnE [Propionibacteriaceae bacterium]
MRDSGGVKLTKTPPRVPAISIAGTLAVLVAAFMFLEVDFVELLSAFPAFIGFFAERFMPPDFSGFGEYLPLLLETVLFAVVATYLSSVLALVGGLLLSERTNSIAWLRFVAKVAFSVLRNVPYLVWAVILVYIFGIGNMVGLLALIFATLGLLSRSYAESLNEIAGSKMEALQAVGASKAQILVHGILPEFVPALVNWTLFSFEINIRASIILGMVGAGGIGIMIQTNLRLFRYHSALALILALVALVLLTEFVTNKLRGRVR